MSLESVAGDGWHFIDGLCELDVGRRPLGDGVVVESVA